MRISWVREQYFSHIKNSMNISYSVTYPGVELPKGGEYCVKC